MGATAVRDAASIKVPVAVFGRAQRVPLSAANRSFERSVGLLVNNSERMVCSAFCVDDAIVATAAHCLFRTAGEKRPRLADFRFIRRIQGAAASAAVRIAGAGVNATSQSVLAGSRQLSVKPPIEATRDWAFVRLDKPICQGATLAVRPGSADDIISAARERRLYQVGFHRDFADWRLAIARGCGAARNFEAADWSSIERDFIEAQHLILHTCDTGGASSGSPLLIDGANGPEVVGINVGTYVQTKVLVERGEIVHRYRADPVANTGVSAEAFAAQLALFREAQLLNSAAHVRDLQARLKARGIYFGALDGVYGINLKQAIEAYEQTERLPVSGLATLALLRRLGDDAVTTSSIPSSDRPPPVRASRSPTIRTK